MPASPTPGSPDSAKGRVAGSPERPPSQQIDFEFLNFSHPNEAKASRARRTVRSHVTRHQHQREQQQAAAARRTRSFPQSTSPDLGRRPPRLKTSHTIGTPGEVSPRPETSPMRSTRSAPSSSVASTTASPLQSPTPSGTLSNSGQLDPYDIYPQQWHTSIPIVIEHYLANLAAENPALDGEFGRGLLRHVWFPFVLTNTALLHSVLLLAAAHCSSVKGSGAHNIDIITLRGMALRAINDSVQNPASSMSDELVGAIFSVATYEAIFGDNETYAMHMTGLQKLVAVKGGLHTLGLDGLLERMLLWVDSNASYITGCDVFFPKMAFPSNIPHPSPEPIRFGARRDSLTRSS